MKPPFFQFSTGFSASTGFPPLVALALGVLAPGGVLLTSTNAAKMSPEAFVDAVEGAVGASGRKITARHFATQAPDFAPPRGEAAYLKILWLRIE